MSRSVDSRRLATRSMVALPSSLLCRFFACLAAKGLACVSVKDLSFLIELLNFQQSRLIMQISYYLDIRIRPVS